MIEEIFVVDEKDRVLFGDPARYPRGAEYPVHCAHGLEMVQIRMNDVRIGVLYGLLDRFSMLTYLNGLRRRLERRLGEISSRSVQDNYFLLFGLLNKREGAVTEKEEWGLIPALGGNNAYVDVVEHVNAIVDGGKIVMNRRAGSCILNSELEEERTVRIVAKNPTTVDRIEYKSDGAVSEELNGVDVRIKRRRARGELFQYWIEGGGELPVEVERTEKGYVVSCRKEMRFEFLEIRLPVARTASKVVRRHGAGRSEYDEKGNVLRWMFENETVRREAIECRVDVFSECEDLRSVEVRFCVREGGMMEIVQAECVDSPGMDFWIRYRMCNGQYEIRM